MRILFLTQILPYPPDAGPRVKTWNVLRYLVRNGHEVHLASFVRAEEEPYVFEARRLCASVTAVPMRRSRPTDIFAWARSLLTGRPFLIERDNASAMRERVRELLAARGFDAIHADQLSMTQFAIDARGSAGGTPLLVFDAHNAVWKVVERMKSRLPGLLGRAIELEERRTKAYEGQMVRTFDRTLTVSEPDRAALIEAAEDGRTGRPSRSWRECITVVPIGVDTNGRSPIRSKPDSRNILALGTLHYPPNADGIGWFARTVYPHVKEAEPGVSLTIVGKNPPAEIRRLRDDPSIAVTGYVSDLGPPLEAAALMVIPVRVGGGMRVRILEGFARGIPMVTTTVGLEGIDARPGRDILVADTATEFSKAVVRLLEEPELRDQLASSGRRLAGRKYGWQVALRPLDEVYARVEVHAI